MSTGFRWPGSFTEQGLKIRSVSFTDWLWSVIEPALGWKTIPDLLHINSTHMVIAYAHLTAPRTSDYLGYVGHVRHAVRSSSNHVITCARICQVPTPREVE